MQGEHTGKVLTQMETAAQISHTNVDILPADFKLGGVVQLYVDKEAGRLWVNVNGQCIVRIQGFTTFTEEIRE